MANVNKSNILFSPNSNFDSTNYLFLRPSEESIRDVSGYKEAQNQVFDKILKSAIEFDEPPAVHGPIVHHLLEQAEADVKRTGHRAWLVDAVTGNSVLRSSVGPMSRRAANVLSDLGFKQGDLLHIACSSSLDFFWPVLGAWLCGGSTSIGNPAVSVPVIRTQLEDTKAKIVVCSKDYADKFAGVIKNGEFNTCLLVLNSEPEDKLPAGAFSFKLLLEKVPDTFCRKDVPPCNPEDSMLIFWTSDSTGCPMGIVRTQEFSDFSDGISTHKTILTSTAFSTYSGFCVGLYTGLRDGAHISFIPEGKFDGKFCLEYLKRSQVRELYLTTEHFIKLGQEVPVTEPEVNSYKCLRRIFSVGKAVNNAVAGKLSRVVGDKVELFKLYRNTEFF